jgi:hypothetical protein
MYGGTTCADEVTGAEATFAEFECAAAELPALG